MNWFTKLLNITKVVAAIYPVVVTFVENVENSLPAGTPGAQKLEIVKQYLQSLWGTLSGVEATFEEVWPSIAALVGALVTAYNSLGVFKKNN